MKETTQPKLLNSFCAGFAFSLVLACLGLPSFSNSIARASGEPVTFLVHPESSQTVSYQYYDTKKVYLIVVQDAEAGEVTVMGFSYGADGKQVTKDDKLLRVKTISASGSVTQTHHNL